MDLLDEAKRRCKEQLVERGVDMTPEEMELAAEALGCATSHKHNSCDWKLKCLTSLCTNPVSRF